MNELLYYRPRGLWVNEPVCNDAERNWIIFLSMFNLIVPEDNTVITRSGQLHEAVTIQKHYVGYDTRVVLDCDEPQLVGALLGQKEFACTPLRPMRPNVEYKNFDDLDRHYFEQREKLGFAPSEPLINIFMELLRRKNVPVNLNLPNIIASYWPE